MAGQKVTPLSQQRSNFVGALHSNHRLDRSTPRMKALSISPFFVKYIAIWTSFCLVAVFILVWDRKRLLPEWREYLSFLCVPWKLRLFAPAFLFVTIAGRYN